ncbi:MAG: HAD-IIB family hydrolase, partial [Oscillospiraceae bacterium]
SYICDNGAFAVLNGKIVRSSVLDKYVLKRVLEITNEIEGVQITLCGAKGTYYFVPTEKVATEVKIYHPKNKYVKNVFDIDDDIFKVAIYDSINPKTNSFPILEKHFGKDYCLQISGQCWMDIMNKGITKGAALQKMQQLLGITKQETMAFGDFYNDLPMLKNAKYAFVMENAHPEMKKHATHIAKNCNEDGVVKAIEEFVLRC